MSNGTKVNKRNGSIEPLNLEKIHKMVELACDGLAGVSSSQLKSIVVFNSMTVSVPKKYKKYLLDLHQI